MKDFKDYQLKQNPFRLTPPVDPDEVIWAGFDNLKSKIEERIKLGILSTGSKIVLNWGQYGSGKTHAATYYSRTKRIQELTTELGAQPSKSIKISLPRTSKDSVQAFLRSILGQIKFGDIIKDLKKLLDHYSKEEVKDIIRAVCDDNIIEDFFILMLSVEEEDHKIRDLEKYIYGDSTKGTLSSVVYQWEFKMMSK